MDLLPGTGYKLDEDYSQQVIIEDINYQAEILQDPDENKTWTTICDAANALELGEEGCNGIAEKLAEDEEISLEKLKGLGYVTVQVQRENGDSTVNGDFFNNALAAGLPVHYTITSNSDSQLNNGPDEDYFANQLNYNDTSKYDEIYSAVVVSVTEKDDPAPGTARIYFAALPDALKEEPESYTLSLDDSFINLSYNPDNFCTEETSEYCWALRNAPDENYQFYVTRASDTATFTINDSGEFTPSIITNNNIDVK